MLLFSLPHTPGKCNAFEGSSQLSSNFTWGSAQVRETAFLGSLPQTLLGKLRTNQGNCFLWEFTSNSTRKAPRKLRDKPNSSSHGHGCCVSGSGPRAGYPPFAQTRPCGLRQLGSVAEASAALHSEASQCVRVEESRLVPESTLKIYNIS